VRTVTACQGNAVCPSGNIDTYKIAQELDRRYYARELPHKFKFGVTGCQNNCLKAEENDLGIKGALDVSWIEDKCTLCGVCEQACRTNAIEIKDGKLTMDAAKCNDCGRCVKSCPFDAWQGESAYHVTFGGIFGNTIAKGHDLIPLVKSEEQLYRITDATIQFFEAHAKAGERFKFTLDRIGVDTFKTYIMEAYNGKNTE
jgi:dissimilatory sulfite reductase (desulfoviridin) alpha/beta subunit